MKTFTGSSLLDLSSTVPATRPRVDVDEHEEWRVRPGAKAIGHVRGNVRLETLLRFVGFEPFVVKRNQPPIFGAVGRFSRRST
jgi:hypothetical protein